MPAIASRAAYTSRTFSHDMVAMPSFTVYRLHNMLGGRAPEDLDDFIDLEDQQPAIYGPADQGDFRAKLYVSIGPPTTPVWTAFVRSGFNELGDFPTTRSIRAVIVLQLIPENEYSALSFGVTGRYLLKQEAWQRSYGYRQL